MNFEEMKKKYNIRLDKQQELAVQMKDGATLLLAVPGSGKTTVIVSRIGYLIHCCDVLPEHILTLTYNKSAQIDMTKRFSDKFGEELGSRVRFRTIHSFCCYVISLYNRNRKNNYNNNNLIPSTESVIRQICINKYKAYLGDNDINDIVSQIGYCRNMLLSEEEIKKIKIPKIKFYEVYNEYKNHKDMNHFIDFDDQLSIALEILENDKELLDYVQNKFPYISVDEAQDTSFIQHKIIQILTSKYNNIFMVGDEDQSIYGFRAAYPKALLNFEKDYKDAKVMFLETNYRSTSNIVEMSSAFIKQNVNRKEKETKAHSNKKGEIHNITLNNMSMQYDYIIKHIVSKNEEVGILFRNNESALPLIKALIENHIPYHSKEVNYTFFNHFVLNDIRDYLEFARDLSNIHLFGKIYYKLGLYLSKDEYYALKENIKTHETVFDVIPRIKSNIEKSKVKMMKSDFQRLIRAHTNRAMTILLDDLNYSNYLKKKDEDGFSIASAKQKMKVYQLIANDCKFIDSMDEIDKLQFLIKEKEYVSPYSKIILSTVHSSKGLEYDNVVLLDVIDNVFPSKTAVESLHSKKCEDYEEEVRLFYVAITRAKNNLSIISYKNQIEDSVDMSCFVHEIFDQKFYSKNKRQLREIKYGSTVTKKTRVNKQSLKNHYDSSLYTKGRRVDHLHFEEGTIINMIDGTIDIDFDKHGRKQLSLELCINKHLIKLID